MPVEASVLTSAGSSAAQTITELSLCASVVVLAGPNRVGKSTVARPCWWLYSAITYDQLESVFVVKAAENWSGCDAMSARKLGKTRVTRWRGFLRPQANNVATCADQKRRKRCLD